MIHLKPGESWTYNYSIPDDHMAGTHWYHSHMHGSSSLQVAGAMVGALRVNHGASGGTLPASYTAMPSHLMVLSHMSLCRWALTLPWPQSSYRY